MTNDIVFLNGSPKKENGNTAFFLNYFKKGLIESGRVVAEYNLYDLKGNECLGCHSCWQTGRCIHDDEITAFLKHIIESQLIIWATPLYFCTMTSQTKKVIERFSLYVSPIIQDDARRKKEKIPDFALFSTCFFQDKEHFNALSLTFKEMCKYANINYVFELFIPAAPFIIDHKELYSQYFYLIEQAGKMWGKQNVLSHDIISAINTVQIANNKLFEYHNKIYKD